MQRERSAFDSFPEPIDLNQGSFPNNTSMDHSRDSLSNPVQHRLSNYMLAATNGNDNCATANGHVHSFSGWDRGESSSSRCHLHDGAFGNYFETRHVWSASVDSRSSSEARFEKWSSRPSNSSVANHVSGRSMSVQNCSSSNHGSLSISPNHGLLRENDCHSGREAFLPNNLGTSSASHSEMEQIPTLCASSSSNVGTSDDFTFPKVNDAPTPSFGTWGTSCKRKTLEGTSGKFYAGGTSSSSQPLGKNVIHHPVPNCYTGLGNSGISGGTWNFSQSSHSEQLSLNNGINMSRVPGISESSATNLVVRSNHRHGVVQIDTPIGTSARNLGAYDVNLSRLVPNTGSSEMRLPLTLPMNQNIMNQPYSQHVDEARGMHSHPWNGSFSSRGGGSSGSFAVYGERDSGTREEMNARSSHRNNLEAVMGVSPPETANIMQGQIDWSYTPGTSASSRNQFSSSRIASGSVAQSSSSNWLHYQNQALQIHHQRLSESAPWITFPHVESASGIRRNHFVHLPSATPSSEEGASTIRGSQHQSPQNSAALFMDIQGGDINGWRAMTAVEGRHRMIRQILSAMRRSGRVQAEDYMLIEPIRYGFTESHDRHRDLRLDVDNMSYEELLALEEHIGNVSTGLSDEKIAAYMRRQKYESVGVAQNIGPCCICQDDYIIGDDIGMLDCGHQFHTGCIEQWLKLKNLCPVCKTTALEGLLK